MSRSRPYPRHAALLALFTALSLAACGGSSEADPSVPETPGPTAPPPSPPPAVSMTPAAPTAAPSAAPSAAAPEPAPAPVLKAIDVYGTKLMDSAWVKTRFSATFQRWFDTEDEAETKRLEKEMVDGILAEKKEIGWVKFSPVTYYNMGKVPQGYVTVDVVERKDMKKRLTFGPEPKGDFEDPAGLIAAWNEYESTFFRMMREQEIGSERVPCPAFHCMGGYKHEKLRPYGDKFVKDVPPNEDKLIRILKEDKDPKDRASAAFLLAHIKDGKKLVGLMLPMLNDPDFLVRNNATRVLVNVAMFHHDVPVPLTPVLKGLDGPTMTDRNKAAAVTWGLVDRPDGQKLHAQVIKEAGATLIGLLRLEQPNNHDFAYKILKKVSGKDLGERDYDAWTKWLAEQKR
ncbi:HEAT repeat domain-containing protein [Polyangium aurulentum]|uniref:HEAT repeat domain-containing protein n=1 Tax=Polyangium aurulentum TaxID=2567896 RepID=UPI00146F7D17|nr:HEAT repeat domain-containing protein [Polyangium aurulentum]UQA61468.1 HEAT repeat domain-containing protein [Polyangium aurulentum]